MGLHFIATDTEAADIDQLAFDLDYRLSPLADRLAEAQTARADLHRQAARIEVRLAAIEHEIGALEGTVTAYRTAQILLESGERVGFVRRELAQMLMHRPVSPVERYSAG